MSEPCYTGLTVDASQAIIDAVAAGNYEAQAAAAAGITVSTLNRWIKAGNDELARRAKGLRPKPRKERFAQFALDLFRARARSETQLVTFVSAAAREDWRAAAWLLERGPSRARFKRADRVELTGAAGGELNISISPRQRIEERLDAMLRKLDGASNVVELPTARSGEDG